MTSKITRLRWPPYRVQSGGAQYTHYLKIVFEYNNQRKDLMDKPIIDGQWERMVNEQIREKHIRRALIETVNKKDVHTLWRNKYTPEEVIICSVPRVEGTKRVPINGRIVNVPINSKDPVDRIGYTYFASSTLPRANLHRTFDRETTDKAWSVLVDHIVENWVRRPKHTANQLLGQTRSHAVDKYWAEREAEQEAAEQGAGEGDEDEQKEEYNS